MPWLLAGIVLGAGGVVTVGYLTLRRWAKELGERIEAQDQSHLATHEIVYDLETGWMIRTIGQPYEVVAQGFETDGKAQIECMRRDLLCTIRRP